ncbi:MAG: branched-chain amino acid ABC transporter permease [Candidatus Geothermarchaeales archaeon]
MVLPPELVILVTTVVAWFGFYLIVTLTLNVEYGFAGIPNFGKMLVVAGGAFVAGFFPGRFVVWLAGIDLSGIQPPPGIDPYIFRNTQIVTEVTSILSEDVGLSLMIFIATLAVAAVVGAGLGYIAAYPTVRLREEFLAMTLLGVAEVWRLIGMRYEPLVGGAIGVQIPDPFAWIGGALRFQILPLIILGIALLIFFYVRRLTKSPLGRVLRAVRDSEVAAATVGKNIVNFRIRSLVVASALGAIAGALFSFYTLSLTAVSFNRVWWTFWPWVMLLMGGMANNWGVLLGTFTFVAARQLIFFYNDVLQPFIPFSVVWLDPLLLGGALLAILMFRPQGILPEKPIKTLSPKEMRLGAIGEETAVKELGPGRATPLRESRSEQKPD